MSELWAACPFCNIIHNNAPATYVQSWDDAIAIVPHRPVTDGHVLVIPRVHVPDYMTDPDVTVAAMRRAAQYASAIQLDAPYPSNLITSAGRVATQTVRHLHVHIVPRSEGDGLALPWTSRATEENQ